MNFKSPYNLAILAIVLYSTSMLVYGTLRIFIGENIDAISAYGSVLGAIGAFFAAFVALIIFDGWKIQHNKNLNNKYAEKVLDAYNSYLISTLNFDLFLPTFDDVIFLERLSGNQDNLISKQERLDFLREEINKAFKEFISKLNYYGIISENENITQNQIKRINEKFIDINKVNNDQNLSFESPEAEQLSIGYKDLSITIESVCIKSILKSMRA